MKKAFIIWLALAVASGCSKADGPAPDTGGTEVGFSLAGVSAEVSSSGAVSSVSRAGASGLSSGGATRAIPENLAPGSTVRVLAYTRRAAGAAADIERDTYVAEATYRVKDDYSLEPCVVDGMTGVATGTAGASPMRLRAGAYDFYALTPALSLTGHKEASVAHGTDYACSLTAACAVATRQDVSTQTVVLATLERKCSRLAFSITRKAENVAKAVINSVELSGIARSPAAALLCENLPTGTNDGGYEFPQGTFVQGAEPYQYSGTDEVLPKSDAAFDLQMSVTFNEADRATDLQATVPAMAFDPGKRYNFDLSLQGGFIVLTLQVTPWNVGPVWDTSVGEPPYASVVVGSWEIREWSGEIGGNFVPVLDPGSWSENPQWDSEIGG